MVISLTIGIRNPSFTNDEESGIHSVESRIQDLNYLTWESERKWNILETGHCVCLEVVSIFPPFVLAKKKKNTTKGEEAFQGKFVVIVEGFAR